jgi:hypothetical protein
MGRDILAIVEGPVELFRPHRSLSPQNLAEGSGEGVRLACPAELATEESVVAAREGDWLRAQPLGDGNGRAARYGRRGALADSNDDSGRRGAQGLKVMLVSRAGGHIVPQERVVA